MISVAVSIKKFLIWIFLSDYIFLFILTKTKFWNLGDNYWVFCRHWIFTRRYQYGLQVSAAFFWYFVFYHTNICLSLTNSLCICRKFKGTRTWAAIIFVLGFWMLDLANNTVQVNLLRWSKCIPPLLFMSVC